MSYTNGTTHYNLPLTTGADKRDWSDTNQAFSDVDAALYGAVQDTAQAELDIDALETRMDTAEQNISTNTGNIAGLDTRLTTAEGAITSQSAQITDTRQDLEDMICAYNEASATSTHAYAIGDYFIYNDVLYKATQAIAIGDTIVPDTNCTTTNVTTELSATEDLSSDVQQLKSDMTDAQEDISDLESDVFALRFTDSTERNYLLDQLNAAVAFLADKPLTTLLKAVIEVFDGEYCYRVTEVYPLNGVTYLGLTCNHLEENGNRGCIDFANLPTSGAGTQYHKRFLIATDGTITVYGLDDGVPTVSHPDDAYKHVKVYY